MVTKVVAKVTKVVTKSTHDEAENQYHYYYDTYMALDMKHGKQKSILQLMRTKRHS